MAVPPQITGIFHYWKVAMSTRACQVIPPPQSYPELLFFLSEKKHPGAGGMIGRVHEAWVYKTRCTGTCL